jgi:ankyrin repeat protein
LKSLNRLRQKIRDIEKAPTDDFHELARMAGLDPATDFQGMDLSKVDFLGCNLKGFNFRGSFINPQSFFGAYLIHTDFDDDQLKQLSESGVLDAEDYLNLPRSKIAVKASAYDDTTTMLDGGVDFNLEFGGDFPLLVACEHGHLELVDELLESGVAVDQQSRKSGVSALMIACRKGDFDIVHLLVGKWKADMELRQNYRATCIAFAVQSGNAEIVKYLYDRGADINSPNLQGMTLLTLATQYQEPEVVRAILEFGVDINERDRSGWTALMDASDHGDLESVKLLLSFGANAELTNNSGLDAYSVAMRRGHKQIQAILKQSLKR